MTPQTKEILLGQLRTWGAGAGLSIATAAGAHGFISGTSVASVGGIIAGIIVTGVCSLYSWWDKEGRDEIGTIIRSQIQVLTSKSLAQAKKIKDAGLAPVTVKEIAAASAASPVVQTMAPVEVVNALATLPSPVVQATVADPAKVVAMIAVLILGSLLAFPSDAFAQTCPAKLTGNPIADAKAAAACKTASTATGAVNNLLADLAKPFQELATFIGEDLDGAVALSTVTNIKDGHGQQCWIELRTFGAIIKAHPVPLTLHAATDLEALRLLQIAANRVCANVHCTTVFADLSTQAQQASPMPLPIPSLHDICSKVTTVAIVDPITDPAPPVPTPTPAPTPVVPQ